MLKTQQAQKNILQQKLLAGLQLILLVAAVTMLIEHRISAEHLIQLFYLLLILTLVNLVLLHRLRVVQSQERLEAAGRETRLLKEQKCSRNLIELLSQTVFEIDFGGNLLYSNQQGFKVTGYTQEEFTKGLNVFQLLVPEDHERARQNLGRLFREGDVQCHTYTLQRKNGSRFPVRIHSTPILQDQRIVGLRGIVIDITERQHAEEELQRHREHLQELVEEQTTEIVQVNKALQQEVLNRLEAQKALRKSDERFRRAILDAPFPIMIHAEDGEVILLSHAWSEMTGYSSEELPNVSVWLSKAYGNDSGKVRQLFQGLYGINRKVYEGESEIRTANGLTRIWEFSSAPLGRLADGRRAVISVGVDISGRKRVEEILREKESAIASSMNGIALSDLEGTLTYVNNAFLALWGYQQQEEVLGRSVLDFWREPEKATVIIDALQHGESWFGELTAKKKDDSSAVFQLSANLIRNEQGRPISMMASFIDITEHKRAEKALRENEKKLNDALNMGRMGFWEYHVDSRTIEWSEQVFTLYERDPALGPPSLEEEQHYYLPEQAELLARYAGETIEKGRETRYDLQVKLPGGRQGEFSSSMHAISDEQGKVVKLFGTVQDITERKQIEEQLKTSLQEKEVLLKEIHHRVKNNLQVIASMLYLQSKTLDDPDIRDLFLENRNRIKSMALVHESLYQSENLARIDIAAYIRHLVVNVFRSYRGSSLGITSSVKVDEISLSTEAAIPCGLIVNELVSNALKYAFPNRQGDVLVEMTKETEERIVLRVSDSGVGFPADFDERQNASLGIKLVHSLVDQLDGTIEIHNKQGSTFRIEFREPMYRKRI